MTRFIVVPQWQGSPSPRAMLLVDGAAAIQGDLPRSATTSVEVPLEAGEAVGTGIQRYSALRRVRDAVAAELAILEEPAMIIGGDCGSAVGGVEHAAERYPNLAVVWLDAHPDLHTPATSPSGAFSGMALRAVLGEGGHDLVLEPPVAAARIVLGGARDFDGAEEDVVTRSDIALVAPDAFGDDRALLDAVRRSGADAVYVHVDLDVLDPSAMTGVSASVPFGLTVADVVAAIARLRSELPLAGSSIAGFSPGSQSDAVGGLGAILRLVGALA